MEQKPWLDAADHEHIDGIPDYGWRVRMDHKWQEPCVPFTLPRFSQILGFFWLSVRYTWAWIKKYWQGKRLFIDNLNLIPWRPIYGAPIGGIGTGTIGRGYCGEFCRYQIEPGMYTYNTVHANQFMVRIHRAGRPVYQQVLSPHSPRTPALSGWQWKFPASQAHYHALYPRAWTLYEIPEQNIRLICRQISPFIPHNYKDSSFPCAVFVWTVENTGSEAAEVSIIFTFQSGQGELDDRTQEVTTEPFTRPEDKDKVTHTVKGVQINQKFRDMPCTYAVSAREKSCLVSCRQDFDPEGSGEELWEDILKDGALETKPEYSTTSHYLKAVAVCCKCSVLAGEKSEAEFSLSWDMPVIEFGSKGAKYARRYTRWFGREGRASPDLSVYALHNYNMWEKSTEDWQQPILTNSNYPAWYKSALFNELYFISDGGTVWVDPVDEEVDMMPVVKEYGRFAYLEGQEYRMYNTYDVHTNASFAFLMLWPKLQLSMQYDIAAAIPKHDSELIKFCMGGEINEVKSASVVPHDMGDPDDEPWKKVNAYLIHPTQEWKDLNIKFVLQVYRDYAATGDKEFICYMYPFAKTVMENSLRWDKDEDGVIENAGFPDQTYDAWVMSGASAYCGGMWLAALQMFCDMAELTGNHEDKERFSAILEKGKTSFEKKLWNGSYYNFDSSLNGHHDSVMSDQLAGHWYLKASGVPDDAVFPRAHVRSALDSIYQHNVLPFNQGTMGAINGMRPDGQKDMTSPQSEEFWTGVVYSLAATMFQEQKAQDQDKTLLERGWQVAYGAYHVNYHRYGLAFQTPEAYMDDRRYRSLGYMRPLCIWSMQYALEKFHPDLCASKH